MSYTSHCGLHTEGFYATAGRCTASWEGRKEYIQHSANHLKIALTQHQHTLNKLRWSSSPRQRSQGVGNPAFRLSPRKVIGQRKGPWKGPFKEEPLKETYLICHSFLAGIKQNTGILFWMQETSSVQVHPMPVSKELEVVTGKDLPFLLIKSFWPSQFIGVWKHNKWNNNEDTQEFWGLRWLLKDQPSSSKWIAALWNTSPKNPKLEYEHLNSL